jgi:hypothetical protein
VEPHKRLLGRISLICGIVSSLFYAGADVLAAMRYADYHSFTSQSISELMALGAPSRPLVLLLLTAHGLLALAFGIGVWGSAAQNFRLRLTGWVLIALGVVDLAAPFFPMHVRGADATLTDSLHIILTIATVLLILLAIAVGAAALGKWFRRYSIATILILVVFGALAGLEGVRIAAQEPTPWVGVTERINIAGYLLWQVVLAISLLRVQGPAHCEAARNKAA